MSRGMKVWRQPIKCARPSCANVFVPQNRDSKFCPKCRKAAKAAKAAKG